MSVQPSLHPVPAAFERGTSVIYLSPEAMGYECETAYTAVIESLRSVFTACRRQLPTHTVYPAQLEVTYQLTSDNQRKHYAILRPTHPKWSQYAVGADIASGFEYREYEVDEQREHTLTDHTLFSLGHQGCDDDKWMYAGKSWTTERAEHVRDWLTAMDEPYHAVTAKLLAAAYNPELNPGLARQMRLNEALEARLQHGQEAVGALAVQSDQLRLFS